MKMKTKYIIKGFIKHVFPDEEIAYFVGVGDNLKFKDGIVEVRKLSATIEGATKYDSYQDALDTIQEYNLHGFDAFPVCPLCHKDYSEHPAISRKDNKSEICPECGIKEALEAFKKGAKK